jgi:hypothetical protein
VGVGVPDQRAGGGPGADRRDRLAAGVARRARAAARPDRRAGPPAPAWSR